MNSIKQFFWLCSGSNIKLLEETPTEGAKYVGIGATIFFTGIFASMAATYAINTFFDNIWISTTIGILWGAMIFNLDRYIVSSMRKSESWKKEWSMALPRLLLAILISLVIARPLELKIFEKEINSELVLMNQEIIRSQRDSINTYYNNQIASLQLEIDTLNAIITSKEKLRNELRVIAREEADGTGGSMRRNPGPIYKVKKAQADQADIELNELRKISEPIIAQKRASQLELKEANREKITNIENPDYTGFAARLEGLGRLTSNSNNIWLANIFLIFLFIAIETAPVLVKLISSGGPYDHLLASIEYGYKLDWVKEKARRHSKLRRESKRFSPKEQEFIDHYLSSNLN
ncbi:MAG: DUF4407 domain-containing protein [Bacteroidota bacterium]